MKILFIGDLNEYGRSFQRFRTFGDMGYFVFGISTVQIPYRPGIEKSGFVERIMWKLGFPPDTTGANKKIKEAIRSEKFNIIWIEKGVTIRPETLRYIKKNTPTTKLVFCSEDDMYAKHNRTSYFDTGLKYYDIVFTTKVYNLIELKFLGAKRTELFLDSYDEKVHRPMILTDEEKKKFACDAGFIGSFENDRAGKMLFLAENGIKVVIWGNGWNNWVGKNENLIIKNQPLYGDDYAKAIYATKINLCFLRKINRDEVTSRSVEIPACGGFMIAERTKRHQEFFEENKEAIFFSSKEELLGEIKRFLADEGARRRIAGAGLAKCLKSGYNHRVQLERMLRELFSL